VGNGLYIARDDLHPLVPPPWADLLTGPGLIGQAVFVAVAVLLLVEGWLAFRLAGQVADLRADDQASWGGRARAAALGPSPAPSLKQRLNNLKDLQRSLGRRGEWRWLLYAMLALLPATIGLLIGLRELRGMETRSQPFEELFALLVVGTAEGAFLCLVGLAGRSQVSRALDVWLARCEAIEKSLLPSGTAPRPKFWQLLAQGRTCARNGAYDRAIAAFEQALVEWPQGEEARQELAKAKEKKRGLEEQEESRQREVARLAEEARKQTEVERQATKETAVVPEPAWPEEAPVPFDCPAELDPPPCPPAGGANP
jgi:hypothetical protein